MVFFCVLKVAQNVNKNLTIQVFFNCRPAAKRNRPIQLPVNGKNPSFGLQSPDTLPCSLLSDAELQQIITNCGLEGQQLEDLLLLFPDNFCTDSEIIDLTMLPPPKTPDGKFDRC